MMGKILLVEDDNDLRTCLSEVLTFEGYEVLSAASGQEGISLLESGVDVDLVISDHYMRNGSGIELLDFVRKRDPLRPAFFIITGQSEMSGVNVRQLGAQEFVYKPFDIPELFSMVARYVGGGKRAAAH